jgi:anti-sigma B factor antagonist
MRATAQLHVNGSRQPAIVITIVGVRGKEFTLVRLLGDIDFPLGPEMTERVTDVIERGARRLVFDLADVTFVDSTTLGTVASAHKRMSEKRGWLGVVCPDPSMRRLFSITGLDRAFPVHESLASLVSALD